MEYQTIISQLYQDFNDRKIDAVLALLHSNVIWPNGWEGGHVHGHEEVKSYWLRQWQEIDPIVNPVTFKARSGNEIAVGVHQIIKDLKGEILSDGQVTHLYTFEEGKVKSMDIE